MAFRPVPTSVQRLAWLIVATLALASVVFLFQLSRTPPSPSAVILAAVSLAALAALAIIVYRLWALRDLDYWVERDGVRVFWAGDVLILPLDEIQKVEQQTGARATRTRWWLWPAPWVRPWRRGRDVASYATAPPRDCVALVTDNVILLLSPDDPNAFAEAIRERRALGPARRLSSGVELAPYRHHWLYRDHLAQFMLGLGLLLGGLLLAYAIWHFPQLPETIPLHFNAEGVPDRISPRRSLFFLPAITLLIWFFNAAIGVVLYERFRLVSYLLWGAAMVLQIVGLLVMSNLLGLMIS